MTARAVFKKADVQRAIEGVLATGLTISSVEFTSEGFAINVGAPTRSTRPNPLDRLYDTLPISKDDPGAAARQTAAVLKRMPRK